MSSALSREYDIFCHGRIKLLASTFKVHADMFLD